jgi:hypothetical protein
MLTAPSTILAQQLAHMPPLQAKGRSMPAGKPASGPSRDLGDHDDGIGMNRRGVPTPIGTLDH